MSVSPTALTTVNNLKAVLGIPTAVSTYDARLELVIDAITETIEGETNRKLKARRYNNGGSTHATTSVADEDYVYFSGYTTDEGGDTVVDPKGYGIFYLPAYPVQANSVLTFNLQNLASRDSGGETWNTSDYQENRDFIVDREHGVLRLLTGRFARGVRNYRIQMAAGYQTGAAQPYVPRDLENLCLQLSKTAYNDSAAVVSESLGTWSRSYASSLKENDPLVQKAIAKYSRFVL